MMTSSYISVILYFNVCYVCFFFNDTATTEIYTLSYTTLFRSDDTWNRSDEELIAQGARELEKLGLAEAADVERGFVVRMPKAYPFYDAGYKDNVEVIRRWMETNTPNLHPVGRNGMFRYNNQDHSMMTAMLTVQNIVDGTKHDIWDVNVEEDYHEEVSSQRPDATADDQGSPRPTAA